MALKSHFVKTIPFNLASNRAEKPLTAPKIR